MALDKVVDSAALDAQLTSIADAIRSKGGTTDQLTLSGMVDAINEIQTGGGGTGLAYDMGEFVLEADTTNSSPYTYIAHNLGEKPGFILVWTDDYVGVTNTYGTITALGFAWFNKIMGLENWFTSAAKGEGTTVNFTQDKDKFGMTVTKPTSSAYSLLSQDVSSESFKLVKMGTTTYWRAVTTYRYFVSKAWWNVGGVASAE